MSRDREGAGRAVSVRCVIMIVRRRYKTRAHLPTVMCVLCRAPCWGAERACVCVCSMDKYSVKCVRRLRGAGRPRRVTYYSYVCDGTSAAELVSHIFIYMCIMLCGWATCV